MTFVFDHDFDFDPSCGMDLEALRSVTPPDAPQGFDAFWERRHRRALAVDPQPVLSDSDLSLDGWQVLDILYRSTGGFPISGWLMLPRSGTVRRGLVVGHGYGGREGPDLTLAPPDTAILFPCFRGLARSALPPISTNPDWHVLHDIDRRDDYIIGGCVDDLWVAVSVLQSLYPSIAGQIGYSGVSFGGGIGALAMGFDRRIDRGHLSLPTFGHMPMRLEYPSIGSARSVQAHCRTHIDVPEMLRFFDAAIAATRIKAATFVSVARFDPAVAPPCQFAVANALPKFNEIFILDAGHFDYPAQEVQQAALRERLEAFFRVT